MARYGIPYQGNKSKIAKDILTVLPEGKRLEDLFGGGFAISHCALQDFPDKWDTVLYNDINPTLEPFIRDAIAGKYNYSVFHPKWISREEFFAKKDEDAYIRTCWSFGNGGKNYLYGKDIEEYKRQAFEYIVNDIKPDWDFEYPILTGDDIEKRRLQFSGTMRKWGKRNDVTSVERLAQVQNLEGLTRAQNLEWMNADYHDYVYKDGDMVYCDIPYDTPTSKNCYGLSFDHKEFYRWAKEQPFPVYYSSYVNGDEPNLIWAKDIRSGFGMGSNLRVKEGLLVL